MPLTPVYAPELLLEEEAARIVLHWRGFKDRIEAEYVHSGLRCRITLEPAATIPLIDPERLTECERDILEILRAAAPKRLTKAKIIMALDAAGKIHGESTMGFALAHLGERQMIVMPRKGSRDGYGIRVEGVA